MQLFSILIFAAEIVSASRLHHFKTFHRRKLFVTNKQNQLSAKRQYLCTAQICQKCVKAFVFGHESAMKTICKSRVKNKGCCPTQHFVKSPRGDFFRNQTATTATFIMKVSFQRKKIVKKRQRLRKSSEVIF